MARFRDQNGWVTVAELQNNSIGKSYTHSFFERRECTDDVHRGYPYSGGPAFIYKREFDYSAARMTHSRWPGGFYDYSGSFIPAVVAHAASVEGDGARNMQPFLTQGYNKTKPGKPELGLGVAIGELRDLPQLLQGRLLKLLMEYPRVKNIAGAYLEWVFGYKQLIRDIRGMHDLWHHLDATIRSLQAQAGQKTRRRVSIRTFSTSYTSNTASLAEFAPPNTSPVVWVANQQSKHSIDDSWSIDYVAQFSYDMPKVGPSFWSSKAKRVLFGLEPSLSVLWNVLPWTWLTDWFIGIGPALERVSATAVDNLKLGYEYAMWRREISHTMETTGVMKTYQGPMALSGWATMKQSAYLRQGSSVIPFAGILPVGGNITIYQLAILAALGLSK